MKDEEIVGFFWCSEGGDYRVIILDKTRKDGGKVFCEEFSDETPEGLKTICEDAGYYIPPEDEVKRLCESSPHTPLWKRKGHNA